MAHLPLAPPTRFLQAHEAVGMPCIMARQQHFKYNYIHGHEDQLFDLDADPGETRNLRDAPRWFLAEKLDFEHEWEERVIAGEVFGLGQCARQVAPA